MNAAVVQDVVFYALPDHAEFYAEVVSTAYSSAAAAGGHASDSHATVSALFTRFESLQLARVVGSSRAGKMLRNSNATFIFL